MNIFVIRPIRGIGKEKDEAYKFQVQEIKNTCEFVYGEPVNIYDPAMETDQTGSEVKICQQNLDAIKKADVVYVIWDGNSQGVLFDLGMAFALGKEIRPVIGYFPKMTKEKSFANLIWKRYYLDNPMSKQPRLI